MSLGYPPLRPRETGSKNDSLHDTYKGSFEIAGTRSNKNVTSTHPLEYSEENWIENKEKMDMAMLRNIQGVHAPLRLQMERNQARQNLRLPGMSSSSVMFDNLTGRLDTIEFEDIFNDPSEAEIAGSTHALMEKKMGLL